MDAELNFAGISPEDAAEAFARLPAVLAQKLASALNDIGVRVRGTAAENAPVDRGRLQNSISHVVERVGDLILRVRVGSNLDYAAQHEFGAEPFFPPVDELRDWARRVLGDESLAYPVAESISETGLDEQRYLRDAVEMHLEWALSRIVRAVDDAFEEVGLG